MARRAAVVATTTVVVGLLPAPALAGGGKYALVIGLGGLGYMAVQMLAALSGARPCSHRCSTPSGTSSRTSANA